jgi:hypothetical protein
MPKKASSEIIHSKPEARQVVQKLKGSKSSTTNTITEQCKSIRTLFISLQKALGEKHRLCGTIVPTTIDHVPAIRVEYEWFHSESLVMKIIEKISSIRYQQRRFNNRHKSITIRLKAKYEELLSDEARIASAAETLALELKRKSA